MLTINLGKLEPGELENIIAQLHALQAAGLQDIQLQIKGRESREFLNYLATEYYRKQASRQPMMSSLLIASVVALNFIGLGIALWV